MIWAFCAYEHPREGVVIEFIQHVYPDSPVGWRLMRNVRIMSNRQSLPRIGSGIGVWYWVSIGIKR